jgi:A/G-specific adenine glycosylase
LIDRDLEIEILLKKKVLIEKLLFWSRTNDPKFPWRNTNNPYHILIVEMLLRKTKASQVNKVYLSFISEFPTLEAIIKADREKIMNKIQTLGLGNIRSKWIKEISYTYYNMHGNTYSVENFELLLSKKSPYLLNSLKCFAFDCKVAIFDVNVKRIIERVFGIRLGNNAHKNKLSWQIASLLIPCKNYKQYNWALLDLGRSICTSKNPKCNICPLNDICRYSLQRGRG